MEDFSHSGYGGKPRPQRRAPVDGVVPTAGLSFLEGAKLLIMRPIRAAKQASKSNSKSIK